ncbi:MAG TPA: M23 family metallopeptidase [Pseudonocardiaceae bacterium]
MREAHVLAAPRGYAGGHAGGYPDGYAGGRAYATEYRFPDQDPDGRYQAADSRRGDDSYPGDDRDYPGDRDYPAEDDRDRDSADYPADDRDDDIDRDHDRDHDRDDEADGDSADRKFRAPTARLRGRVMMAAVAVGAFAAAGACHSLLPVFGQQPQQSGSATDLRDVAVVTTTGNDQQSLAVTPAPRSTDAATEARQLTVSQQLIGQPNITGAANASASTAGYVRPAQGTLTSTFGGQYGQLHYGIEISNSKDTPIVAAAPGVIIAAGPVNGYGLWVKEQLSDGTILVYARMDSYSVRVGQQVSAGQQIALMGDRGFSAGGCSLHFEVWQAGTTKRIDPVAWLNQQGVTL